MPSKARFRKGDRVFTTFPTYRGPLKVLAIEADSSCASGWAVTFETPVGITGRLSQVWLRHAPKKKEARDGK